MRKSEQLAEAYCEKMSGEKCIGGRCLTRAAYLNGFKQAQQELLEIVDKHVSIDMWFAFTSLLPDYAVQIEKRRREAVARLEKYEHGNKTGENGNLPGGKDRPG